MAQTLSGRCQVGVARSWSTHVESTHAQDGSEASAAGGGRPVVHASRDGFLHEVFNGVVVGPMKIHVVTGVTDEQCE